ncbi:ABC1 kinase family protein [Goodfellowiella coeruleoviolacea]|uniref:Ubiquinone biosynthesis protein n=1 Tax=Goodfellowiella coeruleoviolacea TaxID=334858 RepID=A0AAE3KIT4_9PSEU|nr:AarF/UbiB family protein [Goodfellowiella coeruleoviolacea]MCP2167734.1 ubiquinone biosynthesis protein [Goodfellowiella coeruleoviolacea]
MSDRIALSRPAVVLRAARVGAVLLAALVPTLVGGLVHGARSGRQAALRHLYRRTTALLIRLGPTFVKAGQVLGTRRDVLPPALCAELGVLQDDVPPMDHAETERALAEAFGDELDELFREVDRTPVASGSVACVYRARLRSGRQAALKLRRPGVDRVMALDLLLMRRGAALLAKLPVLRGVPVTEVVDHMAAAVLNQLDFDREASALRRLRANLAAVPRVWVPQVFTEATRPRCIVMEFINGLETGTAERCSAATRKRFGRSGLTAIYQMLFVDGFVHCDMHPGNLYFTTSAQVVVLDAGFSVQLSDRLRRLFAEFFMNMAVGRGDRAAEIVVESSTGLAPGADVAGFLPRMAELVERSHGQSAKEFSLVAFATEMFDLQRRHGVHAAPELIFPLLSLLVIEGTIRDLDPEVDFQEMAKPVLVKGLFGARPAGR